MLMHCAGLPDQDTNKVLAISRIMVAWQPVGIACGVFDMCKRYVGGCLHLALLLPCPRCPIAKFCYEDYGVANEAERRAISTVCPVIVVDTLFRGLTTLYVKEWETVSRFA